MTESPQTPTDTGDPTQHARSLRPFPLTAAQRGIWFAQQLVPETPIVIANYVEIRGPFDVDLLEDLGREISHEFPSAMLRLVEIDGEPHQLVDRSLDNLIRRVDFRGRPDPVAAAQEWMLADYTAPRDILTDRLGSVVVLLVGDEHYFWYSCVHHIALDGYGAILMLSRTADRYTALIREQQLDQVRMAELTEINDAEDTYLTSTRIEKDRTYWIDKAADLPAQVTLAVRAGEMDSRSRVIGGLLPADVTAAVRDAAAALDTADTAITIAALAAYFARATDTTDLVLSLPVSARTNAVLRRSGGMVSNVVPLRFSITPSTSLRELIGAVQLELTGALRHQRYRAEDLRRDIGAGTTRGFYGPAINIMNFPSDITVGAVTGRFNILSTGPVEDLSVNIYPSEGGSSRIDFEANPNRYTDSELRAHYDRFLAMITTLLSADPDAAVGEIDVLSAGERAALVPSTGGTGPRPVLLVDALTAGVTANPDGVALVAGEMTLTYRELDAASSRLAHLLIERGAGPEIFVALAFPRTIDAIVAVWAIAKAGAAFVPVDPNHPAERIIHMLTDSAAVLGLTTSAAASNLPATTEWLCLDVLDTTGYATSPVTDAERTSNLRPDHPAYLIYTSGSTGAPKGVVVTHTGLGNFTAAARTEFAVTTGSRLLRFSSASFDASVFEMVLSFSAGAALVIADPDVYGGEDLTELLARERVTHTLTAPAILGTVGASALPDLKVVAVGGDVCPPDLVARFGATTRFHNSYGPTETTIITTLTAPLTDPASITLGSLIPGVHALVLDSRLRPVAPGATGELYLGGSQVARGYHHRSALTATRFIADPTHPGERLYRTGDLVRWELTDAAPVLHYLGRSDAQIQLNGVRVEPGEVDAALTTHPSIDFALTLVRRDTLVSYIHTTPGHTHDAAEVRGHARSHLPAHLVPTHIVDLPDLPLTPNGKIDQRALPEPAWTTTEYVAPANACEELVAALFADATGGDRVGRDDDFFALGGNSLSATRVVGALRRAAGVRVGVRALFEAPTVARFAAVVAAAERATGPALERRERPDRVPLSTAQSRMWFLNRFDPDATTYTIPIVVRLSGELDVPALRAAVADVVARHESLRTVFPDDGDGPVQVVLRAEQCGVELRVLDPGPVPDRLAELLGKGFDVTSAVPVRAALLPVEADWLLVLAVHHISADGVSTGPLARDVFTAYSARRAGAAPQWSPLPVQYADYTLWQREVLGDESDPASTAARQLAYWRDRLTGVPEVIELPTDFSRPAVASYRGAATTIPIDPSVIERVRALAADRGLSVFMLTHAVFAVLLFRLGAGEDVVIGTPVAGRGDPALDDLVGMFVNTVVLRTAVDPSLSFTSFLDSVRDTDLDAFAHTEIPFDRLVDALAPVRSQGHSPLFQVAFAYDHAQPDTLTLPGLTVAVESFEPGIAQFDLALTLTETDPTGLNQADPAALSQADPAAVTATLRFASDLFAHPTAEALLGRYLLLLDTLTAAPESAVGDVGVLAAAEWDLLVPARGPAAEPVVAWPDLIDAAVATAPETTAVVWEGRDYTYRELDERSNALARVLLAGGAAPEVRVAVAISRSVESVLAVWAVTKTGAAFVPIDPDYPPDRITHMLTDSGTTLGLTTSTTALPHSAVPWLAIDTLDTTSQSNAPITDADRVTPLHPEHPAYLIYTSGSTGKPKGVTITHTGLANLAAERRTRYLLDGTSRFLHNTSPSFDMAIGEQISALSTAATLVISPPGLAGEALTDFLTDSRVTHALITPAVLATLEPTHLPDLKVLGVGGEAVSTDLVDTWAPGRHMRNGYGPTEATDIATVADLHEHHPVTIGHPVHGFTALVLDHRLRPVAPGVPGELYLSGPALARGYHTQPGLTATRFLANPYQPSTRMYRTGDLVTWHTTHDNTPQLRYHGRTDHQIKIRGNRIEPGEINNAFMDHSDVARAHTRAHATPRGDKVLVTYLVPNGDAIVDTVAVRAHATEFLPRHLVPNVVMAVAALPLTPSGKVDEKALPAPDFSATTTYRKPHTEHEHLVADLFAEILGAETVGAEDNFFDLGGNSLSATRLLSRLRAYSDTLSLPALLVDPTPASIAERMVAGTNTADEAALDVLLPIRPRGARPPLFAIHPIIGLSWCYGGLTRYLDADRPLFGLQTPGILDDTAPAESLDELAARYLAEIRRVQPSGPYHVLGWSLGGVIAHTIAVQLEEAGEKVDSLVLLDSFARPIEATDTEELRAADLLGGLGIEGSLLGDQTIGPESVESVLAAVENLFPAVRPVHVHRLIAAATHNSDLMRRHTPRMFGGSALYFTADRENPGCTDGLDSWAPFVRGVLLEHRVNATHWELCSAPALAEIGPIVGGYLERNNTPVQP